MKVTAPIERRRREERLRALRLAPAPTAREADELHRLSRDHEGYIRRLPGRIRDTRYRLRQLLIDAQRYGVEPPEGDSL